MTRRGFCKFFQPWNLFIWTLKCERNKLELLGWSGSDEGPGSPTWVVLLWLPISGGLDMCALLLLIYDVALDKPYAPQGFPSLSICRVRSISHLLSWSVSLQQLHAFKPGAGITWSLCPGNFQRQDSIRGAENGAKTVLDGLWDLGKGIPLPAYFGPQSSPTPQWRTEGKTGRSPSLI